MSSLFRLPATALLLFFFAAAVTANTGLTDADVSASLSSASEPGRAIAMAARPMWNYAQMRAVFTFNSVPTCYPTSALGADGKPNGTQPNEWPDANTGCPNPGAPGREGPPFPTYWVVTRCSVDEIRVVYAVYYQHDGFSNVLIAKGHGTLDPFPAPHLCRWGGCYFPINFVIVPPTHDKKKVVRGYIYNLSEVDAAGNIVHDWERLIVIWKRDGTTSQWKRASLLKSMHSGYQQIAWNGIHSTFNLDNPQEMGAKDKDYPKIYPGWAKHPNFDTIDTSWRDSFSQGCQREYRKGDWWYFPRESDMVWSAVNSPEGKRMAVFDWGDATGSPWAAGRTACSAANGGFIPC
jgi:hypothetical protein